MRMASRALSMRPASMYCDILPMHSWSTRLKEHTAEPTGLIASTSTALKSPTNVSRCTPLLCRTKYRFGCCGGSGSMKPKISQLDLHRARPWPWLAALLATTVASKSPRSLTMRTVAATPLAPGRNGSGQSVMALQRVRPSRSRTNMSSSAERTHGNLTVSSDSLTTSCGHRGVICSSLSSLTKARAHKIAMIVAQRPTSNIAAWKDSDRHAETSCTSFPSQ
mmetsp:Transcript_59144/g.171504  ORF Transcript_59144/g.171504 Transcript_59144/m.171504 type:complete len:222 (+) Transcript_59144:357-1022(+)